MANGCVDHLLEQHRRLERILSEFVSLMDAQKHGPRPGCQRCLSLAASIRAELKSLLHKKDEILFPALEKYWGAESGPVAVLRQEGSQLNLRLLEMESAARQFAADCASDDVWAYFSGCGHSLSSDIRDQIYKEDRVFFPMVARLLPTNEDAQLLIAMHKIDREHCDR
jgi:iron-sulfur cluster repair protein YtfE (RIC family)